MKKLLLIICSIFALASNAQLVSTLAGSTTSGSTDGTGTAATFRHPHGVAADTSGNLYVADYASDEIRKIVISTGVVTTLAGSTTHGSADGTGAAASFYAPYGIAFDGIGGLFVADYGNNMIRKVVISTGVVTTLAGSTTPGTNDGTGTAARFSYPSGIAYDGSGNLFVGDNSSMIRKIVVSTGVVSTLAGSITTGFANGPGITAKFYFPNGVACDGIGNLYVADANNYQIRKIIISTGVVSTLAGSITNTTSIDGTGASAGFGDPEGIAYDGVGNLYVADGLFNEIRKIVISTGVVTTVAGSSTHGSADGTGTSASFFDPFDVACDASGNLYIADTWNNEIRMITNLGAGIEQFANNSLEATIYPNPATTVLNVTLQHTSTGSVSVQGTNQITMYDMLGNSIYHATFTTQHNTISVADLAEGVYFINIKTEQGTTTKKVIITK